MAKEKTNNKVKLLHDTSKVFTRQVFFEYYEKGVVYKCYAWAVADVQTVEFMDEVCMQFEKSLI